MQFIFLLFGKKTVFIFYRLFFAGLVKIFGIKLSISGKIKKENVLYVSNHVSYIDIFLLGSLLDAFFVAKSEISKWPFISTLCRLGKTIFIDRESRFKAKNQVSIIKNNLKKGNNIIISAGGSTATNEIGSTLTDITLTVAGKPVYLSVKFGSTLSFFNCGIKGRMDRV